MSLLKLDRLKQKITGIFVNDSSPEELPKRRAKHQCFRHSDIFLVSYPKSGNTWMRFLIANLTKPSDLVSFENINKIIPDLYKTSTQELQELSDPRIIKSHECFDTRYKKVIYIVRNPYSVSVSLYHHLIKYKRISQELEFKEFLQDFLQGFRETTISEWYRNLGSWSENVTSWLDSEDYASGDFLLIRYEDLMLDPLQEMSKVNRFLSKGADDVQIQEAIQKSNFKSMKNIENKQKNVGMLAETNSNIPFIRSGNLDEWEQYFDKESINLVNVKFGKVMKRLDYETY
ncbi:MULTISPECIES: sulfotransferase domain-containing protein [Crocosphaera]|uniref:Aryl sulfotransferase n=3 Tax=Crocosphaera watsonii TaxID=263511 RepID=T2JTJ1_CROWT|nr:MULTISPECIES: sulfotransferase domain-containing protein [Crocosphaera]EHJ14562.1 Sulfotransferase [Crocosphaera watsonii WH 0003]MCH2244046.1 sulfotransferase domain-containing protein [Crocosphaera sp.]CCQ53956.1 Sulfotransferase [Crocosphaera watsonii WH 0005]CCQ68346.1 aryl sulfotransferase [Crocosphaera watsonii WH 0402]